MCGLGVCNIWRVTLGLKQSMNFYEQNYFERLEKLSGNTVLCTGGDVIKDLHTVVDDIVANLGV